MRRMDTSNFPIAIRRGVNLVNCSLHDLANSRAEAPIKYNLEAKERREKNIRKRISVNTELIFAEI